MKIVILSVFVMFLSACGGSKPVKPVVVDAKTAIWIEMDVPFKRGADIDSKIKAECSLGTKLSGFVKSYSDQQGVGVMRKKRIGKQRNRLVLTINSAVSKGNAFTGHRKATEISGVLYKKGKKVSKFTATRYSGGGFMGAYKGSCSVLGRTVKALGKDTAKWLKKPVNGARLGG